MGGALVASGLLLLTAGARAADPPPDAPSADVSGAEVSEPETLAQRIADLEQRLADTQQALRGRAPAVTVSGYVDFGFFAVGGDGSGVVQDLGTNRRYPVEGTQFAWVFLGDLLAPAVNTRGEPASLGNLPGVDRTDSINSTGAPSFIVNEVNLTLTGALADNALATASVDFLPRSGREFSLGDAFEVDLAQLEWMPGPARRTSIFVGKVDSVIGLEYRERKARQRFGITPSLIARYTTGTPLGLKVRSKLGQGGWLVIAAALTNGSSSIEQFHFYDEIDSNTGKTVSGRLSARLPLPVWLELGVSGSFGAQDRSPNNDKALWFFGPDLIGHLGNLDLKAQWLTGGSPGDAVNDVYGLDLHGGGYLEGDYMFGPSLGALGRIEYRHALVWLGNERAYLTKSWRATVGLRWVWSDRAVIRAEYLHNGEYGGVPSIPNDVFTSSLVLSY